MTLDGLEPSILLPALAAEVSNDLFDEQVLGLSRDVDLRAHMPWTATMSG